VEQFDSAPWIAARAKRMRLYRLLVNSFWQLLLVVLLANLLRSEFPQLEPTLALLWVPFSFVFLPLAVCWFVIGAGFDFGLIKCPSCGQRFAPRFPPWVPKACQNCRYDIYALRRRGDF
jgi:hypothetical protein